MKNKLKLLGIIALAVVIGFSVISCPEPEEKDADIVGTWIAELTDNEIIELADENLNYFVEELEGSGAYTDEEMALIRESIETVLQQLPALIPEKMIVNKLEFTETTMTLSSIGIVAAIESVMNGEEIDANILELTTMGTFPYIMDGNDVTVDLGYGDGYEYFGTIGGNKLNVYGGSYTKQ